MTLVATILIWAAILTSVLAIGVLVLWWRGVDMIALPGVGLIVGTLVIVLLLLIAEVGLVVLATLLRAARANG